MSVSASDIHGAAVPRASSTTVLSRTDRAARTQAGLSAFCLGLTLSLWLISLPLIDPAGLDDYGLISVLPPSMWAAYAFAGLGFALSLRRGVCETALPLLHIMAMVLLLHATPAIVYDTLRYAWAWKHVGVVDYIQRHGQIDPADPFLAAYHNWPGFFVASSALANLAGIRPIELAGIVRFAPPILNLLYVLILPFIYFRFTADPRLVWAGVWLFVLGNWIGQDYYSPQGVAFLLYLVVLALCLGPLKSIPGWSDPRRSGASGVVGRFFAFVSRGQPPAPLAVSGAWRTACATLALLLIAAIVVTHPLTPVVLIVALGGLWAIGRLSIGYVVFALLLEVVWLTYFASSYMAAVLPDVVRQFGDTAGAIGDRLVDTSIVSPGQVVVSWASRALTGALVLAALLGGLRRLAAGYRDGAAVVLTLAPAPLLVATAYGGEILFRVYLFALPFLAFFAGALFFPWSGTQRDALPRFAIGGLGVALACAFILANNGKDRQYRFTGAEVAVSQWLYENAPRGSLLIEGAPNYPYQFMNSENFTYVPISSEGRQSTVAILADPAGELARWLQGVAPGSGFIIITRSQKAYVDDLGLMPKGSFDAVEKALRASARFRLVRATSDASVFVANGEAIGMGEWIK